MYLVLNNKAEGIYTHTLSCIDLQGAGEDGHQTYGRWEGDEDVGILSEIFARGLENNL